MLKSVLKSAPLMSVFTSLALTGCAPENHIPDRELNKDVSSPEYTTAEEVQPNNLVVHIEDIKMGMDGQGMLGDNEYYSLHALASAQILSDAYYSWSGANKNSAGFVNGRYYNIDFNADKPTPMNKVFMATPVVTISSSVGIAPDFSASEAFQFWAEHSPTIIFKAAGNDGYDRVNSYGRGSDPVFYSDTQIKVGAFHTVGVPGYSSPGADIVFFNAFARGFEYDYYPGEGRARGLIEKYGLSPYDGSLVSPDAGELVGGLNGTSFAAPYFGGVMSSVVLEYSDEQRACPRSSYSIWAATLSGAVAFKPSVKNARGQYFNDRQRGYGLADEGMTRRLLGYNYGERTGKCLEDTQIQESADAGIINGSEAIVDIQQDFVTGTVIGRAQVKVDDAFDYFLMRGATLVSPSGTEYTLELHKDSHNDRGDIKGIVFRSTGFLGEDTKGDWTIRFSNNAEIKNAGLYISGSNQDGFTDKMIDYSLDLKKEFKERDENRLVPLREAPSIWENAQDKRRWQLPFLR